MATISADLWGVYLTLTESETKEVETAADVGSAISAIVNGVASGIPGGVSASAVSAVLAGYLQLEKALMGAVDQGAGVTLNLPWLAIYAEQFWLIYPTAVSIRLQANWRWCSRCSGLYWPDMDPSAGQCPTGGAHGPNIGSNYRLVMDVPTYQGQHQWRWCVKCTGLFFAGGGTSAGRCPGGGQHSEPVGGSSDYGLVMDVPSFSGQHEWRWCQNCSGLFFGGGGTSAGVCPAGGQHQVGQSSDYALMS
jgi:hypothetical protein